MDSDFGIPLSPLQKVCSQFHTKLPPCLQVKNSFENLFDPEMDQTLSSISFKKFFSENEDWLKPYAAFCYLSDSFGTIDHSQWGTFSVCTQEKLAMLCMPYESAVDCMKVPDSPVEGIRKLMVAILATQFKWILSRGIKQYTWLGGAVLWTATKTQHCKGKLLSAVGMEASVMNKLTVEEASEKVTELGAAATVSVVGYYGLKVEVSKLIERGKKGVDETKQPPPPEISMLLLKTLDVALKTKKEAVKKKLVKTEEAITPPTPRPPRLLPTWLNRIGVGESRLHREEERMLKYHRSLLRKW